MKQNVIIFFFLTSLFIAACGGGRDSAEGTAQPADPLNSWNEGAVKSSILEFVREVTDEEGAYFVPERERIAVFDNDGTLWSEQPAYFQLFFAMDRVKELAPQHPEWENQQPYRSILEDDMQTFASYGIRGILEVVMATHAGMSAGEFEEIVKEWISTARHPRFDRPYTDLVYQPMLELIRFLQTNGFKVFIVSGGGLDFMRPWVEEVYGIPRELVVGSSIRKEFVLEDGEPVIRRLGELEFIDDKEGKPVAINKFIGRIPLFCAGNSDGDLQMMQYTASGAGKRFMLYLHHTDEVREWAYDRDSHVGRFDKALDEANERGWAVIDMKEDWKRVYPFEASAR